MEDLDIARAAAEIGADKQATDIAVLDMRGVCSFTDYFVIMSADSLRLAGAILDEIVSRLKAEGVRPLSTETSQGSGWQIVDYGPVVVHVFTEDIRRYYDLDKLWQEARPVLRVQ